MIALFAWSAKDTPNRPASNTPDEPSCLNDPYHVSYLRGHAPYSCRSNRTSQFIEDQAIACMNETHAKIHNLVRSLRQALRTEGHNTARKQMADFRELDSTSTREYFKLFPRLFSFLARGFYIQARLKDAQDETRESQLYQNMKDAWISTAVKRQIRDIVRLDPKQRQSEESKRELHFQLTEVFHQLRQEKNKITFEKNTTMNNIVIVFYTTIHNCVIVFYFINTINPHIEEFNNMGTIAKLSSKLIFYFLFFIFFVTASLIAGELTGYLPMCDAEETGSLPEENLRLVFSCVT